MVARCPCGGSCLRCKGEHDHNTLPIRQPGDSHEREADTIAARVMSAESIPTRTGLLQKKSQSPRVGTQNNSAVPPIVDDVLRSPGQPLDPVTRAFMEPRFDHDFSNVRVHRDARAAESAPQVNALAYTVGQDVVFGEGRFAPGTHEGQRILAHELVHVMQQESAPAAQTKPALSALQGGGWSLRAPNQDESNEVATLENEADTVAERVLARDVLPGTANTMVRTSKATTQTVLRTRMPVPRTPLCGKTLTDIEVLPPATKDLEPCLPKGVPFTRINIVGRDATSPSGKNQVFNVHAGYYTDTTTGQYCAMVDDAKSCLCRRCRPLGCFPTLKEIFEAIKKFLGTVLKVLGILLLIAILAEIIALLLELILIPAAALASADELDAQPEDDGGLAPDDTTQGVA